MLNNLTSQYFNRNQAIQYAMKYAFSYNKKCPYYKGLDCTNFISQCMRAGGAKNHFHKTHPWWCKDMETSISWSVAHSFYWYIITCTKENGFGIKAKTRSISGDQFFRANNFLDLQIGDLVQYSWKGNKINHSAMITGFTSNRDPLVTQHQPDAINRSWRRGAKVTYFHHILSIN